MVKQEKRVKNGWELNQYGLNSNLNDLSEKHTLRWFDHRERMKEAGIAKQVYERKVSKSKGRGRTIHG